MAEDRQLIAVFTGDRGGSAPLTWGQQAIWKTVESMAPNDQWLNVRRVLVVPPGRPVGVEAMVDAVGRLVSRHEALRTLVRPGPDGRVQEVLREGTLPVTVVEIDVDGVGGGERQESRQLLEVTDSVVATPALAGATDDLLRRLADTPFRYAEQLPLRVGAVVDAPSSTVRHVVLVISHVAVDWHAAGLVVRDLRRLLGGGAPPLDGRPQALDLSRRERGSTRRTERAVAHWRRTYARLPAESLPLAEPAQPRYQEAILTSAALRVAATRVAARHRVSTSTVLLAATVAGVAAATGEPTCGLLTVVSNRFQPGHDQIVAPMNQLALLAVDTVGRGELDALVPAVWEASLLAYRHAYYDQLALDRAMAEDGHGCATGAGPAGEIPPSCCFNDVRSEADRTAVPREPGPDGPIDRSSTRPAGTTLRWRAMDSFNWRCYLEVRSAPGALCLALAADTAALAPQRMASLLRRLELSVVESAARG